MSNVRIKLIDATFQEVYTHGYNGASLANILNRAEVKKGAMYHYFPSKKDMTLSMIDEKIEQRLKSKWERLEHSDDNIIDVLIEILQDTDNWDLINGCPLGNLLQESLEYDKDFTNKLVCVLDGWKKQFAKVLQKAQDANQLKKDVDIEQCSTFLIASLEGALLLAKKYDNTKDFEACMNQLSFYLNTIRNN